MEAFRLPRKSRPALAASFDGKSLHEQHNDGTLFVSKGVKYYSPVLFYTAPAITKSPFPMLICDVLKLRDCRRVYKNEGYAPASQNILMLGNHPVQKILVQGKVVGERWHEMSQDKFFMFLEISDGTAEDALTIKIQSRLYHQRLNGFEKNSNLLVQVRGVANVYNDQVEICADSLDVVGDKRDMGVEMDWWDRALSMKAEVLEDPWEFRGDVDEAKKNGEKILREWLEERRAAKEEDERLEPQPKRENAHGRQRILENERAEADVANGQASDSSEHDSEGSGYATATEIEESDASSNVEQGEEVEEEQAVKKRRKKEPKTPQTDEQASASTQLLLPPPAFVGTRVSISLLGRFDDDHNAVEKEILRFCMQTADSKFSLDRLMADRSVAVSVYQEILRTRAEQDSGPLNSDMDQHSFKLFFHAARKSLCHAKLLKLTKSSNIETNSLKYVHEYFSNLINHVMRQMKIVVQELKDDSETVEEFCRNMVRFYHTRLGRFVLTSRSMVSKVQEKFSVSITAPMIRQIMAHTICSAETDHSIELEDGLQVSFTWYYLVKHCHYMYLPEIVHSGK